MTNVYISQMTENSEVRLVCLSLVDTTPTIITRVRASLKPFLLL